MDRRKLLIADPSACWCQALAKALEESFEVRICHEGKQAWAMAQSFGPDVMVVELTLPGMDGLSLLEKAACLPKRPALLTVSPFYSGYIQAALTRIGVDYAMMKPCDISAVAEHVEELVPGAVEIRALAGDGVCLRLLELGVQPSRKGFGYLEDLVERYRSNPGASMTKDLYPEVAKQNRTSAQAVERAVRDAIGRAWSCRDEVSWRRYFPAGRSGMISRPTNRAFIAAVATQNEQEAITA